MADTPKTPQEILDEQQKAREKSMAEADAQMAIPPTPTQAENDAAKLGVVPAADTDQAKTKAADMDKAATAAPVHTPYKNRDLKSE